MADEPSPPNKPRRVAESIGKNVGRGIDTAATTIGSAAHTVSSTLTGAASGITRTLGLPVRFGKPAPGTAPGFESGVESRTTHPAEPPTITCIDYSPDQVQRHEVDDLADFLAEKRPEWVGVRWLNVTGIDHHPTLEKLAEVYAIHPLAIEDVARVPQRPKIDRYEGATPYAPRLCILTRMVQLIDAQVQVEQVSILIGPHTVITFQERPGDVFDPIRQRINRGGSALRTADAGFLAYALLDAIVDHYYPILETYGERVEQLEQLVLDNPNQTYVHRIHRLKRELTLLRREVWPMRELLNTMLRDCFELFDEHALTYTRDVYDHAIQVIEIIETYREVVSGLTDTLMTAAGNRMNEIMKVLTMVGAIFIPISFLAGVFGMNFDRIPGLHHPAAFVFFCVACLGIAGGMTVFFRYKKWL